MNSAQSQMLLVGRTLLAAVFLVAGIRKLMALAATTAYFTKLGVPIPEVMVWLVIVVEIGGAVLLIVGWQTRRAAWLMIIFVLIATFLAHRFWQFEPPQYANQLNHFLKNIAIIGGMLYIVVFGPGSLSVDARQGTGRPVTA